MKLIPAAFITLLVVFMNSAQASEPSSAWIAVNGEGEVDVVPDQVVLRVNVGKRSEKLADAKRQTDEAIQRLIEAAQSMDIADDDIDASLINTSPDYRYDNNVRELIGYRVNRELTLTLRDVQRYAELVENLALNDVSNIQSSEFGFSDIKAPEDLALQRAVEDARRRAEAVATQLGRDLGAVYSVDARSTGAIPPSPFPLRARTAVMASDAAPEQSLQVARRTISQSVNVVFLLQ